MLVVIRCRSAVALVLVVALGAAGVAASSAAEVGVGSGEGAEPEPVGVFDVGTAVLKGVGPGWSFLWNERGPAGDPSGYSPLVRTRFDRYNADGGDPRPTRDELAFGILAPGAAHPGRGTEQEAADDRFVIIRLAVPIAGRYRLTNSAIGPVAHCSTGVELQVRADDELLVTRTLEPEGPIESFDVELGPLGPGAPIDVLIGPAGDDTCDGIDLDYRIEVVPTASSRRSSGGW